MCVNPKFINRLVSEWDVRSDSADPPIPRWRHRIASLLLSFEGTTLGIVARELYSLPFRIVAGHKYPYRQDGVELPVASDLTERFPLAFGTVELACTEGEGIQRLQQDRPWVGFLDLRLYTKAFAEGARFAFGIAGRDVRNGDTAQEEIISESALRSAMPSLNGRT
jgi:hypothetical protein